MAKPEGFTKKTAVLVFALIVFASTVSATTFTTPIQDQTLVPGDQVIIPGIPTITLSSSTPASATFSIASATGTQTVSVNVGGFFRGSNFFIRVKTAGQNRAVASMQPLKSTIDPASFVSPRGSKVVSATAAKVVIGYSTTSGAGVCLNANTQCGLMPGSKPCCTGYTCQTQATFPPSGECLPAATPSPRPANLCPGGWYECPTGSTCVQNNGQFSCQPPDGTWNACNPPVCGNICSPSGQFCPSGQSCIPFASQRPCGPGFACPLYLCSTVSASPTPGKTLNLYKLIFEGGVWYYPQTVSTSGSTLVHALGTLYSKPSNVNQGSFYSLLIALYNCPIAQANNPGEITTTDPSCEGTTAASNSLLLGYILKQPVSIEVPLYRCRNPDVTSANFGYPGYLVTLSNTCENLPGYVLEKTLGYIQPAQSVPSPTPTPTPDCHNGGLSCPAGQICQARQLCPPGGAFGSPGDCTHSYVCVVSSPNCNNGGITCPAGQSCVLQDLCRGGGNGCPTYVCRPTPTPTPFSFLTCSVSGFSGLTSGGFLLHDWAASDCTQAGNTPSSLSPSDYPSCTVKVNTAGDSSKTYGFSTSTSNTAVFPPAGVNPSAVSSSAGFVCGTSTAFSNNGLYYYSCNAARAVSPGFNKVSFTWAQIGCSGTPGLPSDHPYCYAAVNGAGQTDNTVPFINVDSKQVTMTLDSGSTSATVEVNYVCADIPTFMDHNLISFMTATPFYCTNSGSGLNCQTGTADRATTPLPCTTKYTCQHTAAGPTLTASGSCSATYTYTPGSAVHCYVGMACYTSTWTTQTATSCTTQCPSGYTVSAHPCKIDPRTPDDGTGSTVCESSVSCTNAYGFVCPPPTPPTCTKTTAGTTTTYTSTTGCNAGDTQTGTQQVCPTTLSTATPVPSPTGDATPKPTCSQLGGVCSTALRSTFGLKPPCDNGGNLIQVNNQPYVSDCPAFAIPAQYCCTKT